MYNFASFLCCILGPPGGHQFRAFGLSAPQRPFHHHHHHHHGHHHTHHPNTHQDTSGSSASFPGHFRELGSLHRVTRSAAAINSTSAGTNAAVPASSSHHLSQMGANTTANLHTSATPISSASNDCQDYKPNAPHIQGKQYNNQPTLNFSY